MFADKVIAKWHLLDWVKYACQEKHSSLFVLKEMKTVYRLDKFSNSRQGQVCKHNVSFLKS
jgi:hypothetical protein